MQVDRKALGEHVADGGAADAEHDIAAALVDDGGERADCGLQGRGQAMAAAVGHAEPMLRTEACEGDRVGAGHGGAIRQHDAAILPDRLAQGRLLALAGLQRRQPEIGSLGDRDLAAGRRGRGVGERGR